MELWEVFKALTSWKIRSFFFGNRYEPRIGLEIFFLQDFLGRVMIPFEMRTMVVEVLVLGGCGNNSRRWVRVSLRTNTKKKDNSQ